jgi:hypothetical protein
MQECVIFGAAAGPVNYLVVGGGVVGGLQLREVAGEQLRVHLEGCRGEHVGGQRQIKTSEGLPLTAGGTHKQQMETLKNLRNILLFPRTAGKGVSPQRFCAT